ncbi:BatA domain-containing protein [Changchengzhania lutea]|uniref:BatA domain-containing protein n=1 Tax=Changchengzhania lutea TaxID=2049305 RepID=UPI00115F2DCF|nr:BatA domain-containing protein [Changchengzhania lutea]
MQFKHPEFLYALFLLLIPIIVHLFQLRKFRKEPFTNVAFLKKVTLQTRKSSQIKKWLMLITRMSLLAAIILAFAQPFIAKSDAFKKTRETVIYLDNSFSMQAKGNQGELLKRAVQNLLSSLDEDEKISIITNDKTFKDVTLKAIKNDLLQLDYSSTQLTPKTILLKSKMLFGKNTNSLKDLIFISDFQAKNDPFPQDIDSLINLHLVKLQPLNANNVFIDTAYVSKTSATQTDLLVRLKNHGDVIDDLPISLFNDDILISKTSVTIEKEANATFSLPINTIINGKLTIEDGHLQFDNSLFFNINSNSKTNVLAIGKTNDSYLKRIFTKNEFHYTATVLNQLNYNILNDQFLIVLNELTTLPAALVSALKQFTNQGGSLLIIPPSDNNMPSYNSLLSNYNISLSDFIKTKKRITTINYGHPLYNNGVFEKQISNFQYPKVNTYYTIASNGISSILNYEDGKPFLLQSNQVFLFSSALNAANSNFQNSPLIVPTLYNIGKYSLKNPDLYYTLGQPNTFDVDIQLQQDDILSLVNNDINIIPKQTYFNNKVIINTSDNPTVAGIYSVNNREAIIKNVSFNYNRSESQLMYQDLSNIKNVMLSDSITNSFNTLKSESKVKALWKWFVIFALVLLIIEMLILKYFK